MTRHTHTTRTALACLLLLAPLAGCFPESHQPLSDPTAARQDTRLHGLWSIKQPNGDVQYLHIGAEPEQALDPRRTTPESGLMRFWLVGHTAQNAQVGNPFGMRFFVSQVGDATFANLVLPVDDKDTATKRTYWFIKYHADATTLATWSMDLEVTAKLIEAGHTPGQIERDNEGKLKRVLLTGDRAQVQQFVQTHAAELFPESHKTTYRKAAGA